MPTATFHCENPQGTADNAWVKVSASEWDQCLAGAGGAYIRTNSNDDDPGPSVSFTTFDSGGTLDGKTIVSVTAWWTVKRELQGGTYKFGYLTSGSTFSYTDYTPTTSYADKSQVITPTGGGSWTPALIQDELKIRFYANGDATLDGRDVFIDEMWISVEYSSTNLRPMLT